MSDSDTSLFTSEIYHWSKSDDISEERLLQIIRMHRIALNDNNLHVSDYLFFHVACRNEKITEGIIQCLLEYFPDAVNYPDFGGLPPLHYACRNKNVSLGIIRRLVEAAPDSIRCEETKGDLPLHQLCGNKELDDTTALEILNLLLEKHPDSIRHTNNNGYLPIHIAAMRAKSSEFCRVLIDAYPGSERIGNGRGVLPFQLACIHNTVEIVEYLFEVYPDAINHTTAVRTDAIDHARNRWYPIHHATGSVTQRAANPEAAVDIVKFLLDCDPRVRFQKAVEIFPTFVIACLCSLEFNDTNIGAGMEIIGEIYDADPEAIEHDSVAPTLQRCHPQVQAFVNSKLVYSRQANDHDLMTTPDEYSYGQLPLHTALQNNVRLGSIKLLVKGNPHALQFPDNSGALPLHIACMYRESTRVVQYLAELKPSTLDAVDNENNTALHYACRGAKYDTIALLLEKYDAVSVSKRNNRQKLPIEVLWQNSFLVVDRESVEYTECIFRLLRAYPETTMNGMIT